MTLPCNSDIARLLKYMFHAIYTDVPLRRADEVFTPAWSDVTSLIVMCCTLLLWLCCSTPTVLGGAGGRFRRETRTLEEEEEMWFDQDEYDEPDSLQLPDVLKPKQDLSLDQFINRYFHDRKSYFGDGGAAGE